jgi:hypothetical protein
MTLSPYTKGVVPPFQSLGILIQSVLQRQVEITSPDHALLHGGGT